MHPSLVEQLARTRQVDLRKASVSAIRPRRQLDPNWRLGWLMVSVGLRLALRSARRRGWSADDLDQRLEDPGVGPVAQCRQQDLDAAA